MLSFVLVGSVVLESIKLRRVLGYREWTNFIQKSFNTLTFGFGELKVIYKYW